MPKAPPFEIVFAKQVYDHLEAIEHKYYSLIQEAITTQLQYEPESATRNRKPLRELAVYGATWELRCGPNNRFRVLYRVDQDQRRVIIGAIGVKIGNRLFIGNEEFEL